MKVVYPVTVITEASRLSVCFRLDGLLLIEHNAMGAKFRAGLITEIEWKVYLKDTFEPQSQAIHFEINKNREIASKSTYWAVNLKTAIVKEVEVI